MLFLTSMNLFKYLHDILIPNITTFNIKIDTYSATFNENKAEIVLTLLTIDPY